MTGLEQRHFEMLRQGPCVPAEYVTAFYWPSLSSPGRFSDEIRDLGQPTTPKTWV